MEKKVGGYKKHDEEEASWLANVLFIAKIYLTAVTAQLKFVPTFEKKIYKSFRSERTFNIRNRILKYFDFLYETRFWKCGRKFRRSFRLMTAVRAGIVTAIHTVNRA